MRAWMKQTGIPFVATISFVAMSFAATLYAHRLRLLQVAEFRVYDHLQARRAPAHATDSPCIVVGVTEDDLASWGANYPMSDRMMAELLEKLVKGEPRAIGVDIIRSISIPERHLTPAAEAHDVARLEAVVSNQDVPIIMLELIGKGQTIEAPPPGFFTRPLAAGQVGFVDQHPDDDQVLRRALLTRIRSADSKSADPSMALLLAENYLGDVDPPIGAEFHGKGDSASLRMGKASFAKFLPNDGDYVGDDAGGFQILIDYSGPRSFRTLSASEVLSPKFDPAVLRDGVVLIGTTAESVKDFFRTPLTIREPGVVSHARIADQLIRAATQGKAVISVVDYRTQMLGLLLMCAAGGALGHYIRSYWKFFIAVGTTIASLLVLATLSMEHGLWVPIVRPVIGFILAAATVTVYMSYRERLDRLAMMQLFERSVSGVVAKSIWQRRDEIFEGGRLRTRETPGTVLFTDLVNFSGVAERLDAKPLIDWLNEYFEKISDLVCKWGGNINKFNGDQIVAVFGPPLDRNEAEVNADARGAVSCALEMRAKLCELNDEWRIRGMPQTRMRIGVHTGSLVAGSLGSRERQEWTVIGDTVNIASRLESFDKNEMSDDIAAGGCRILISGSTFAHLDPARLNARSLGHHELSGRKHKIEIFGVSSYDYSAPPSRTVASPTVDTNTTKAGNELCNVR